MFFTAWLLSPRPGWQAEALGTEVRSGFQRKPDLARAGDYPESPGAQLAISVGGAADPDDPAGPSPTGELFGVRWLGALGDELLLLQSELFPPGLFT
jgi:hypothetical protein